MTTTSGSPSWEEVLADCERTATQAEELLNDRGRFDAERYAALTAMDLWELSMPPLPEALLERAHSLHERQLLLQAELISNMSDVLHQIQITSANLNDRSGAHFIDRLA